MESAKCKEEKLGRKQISIILCAWGFAVLFLILAIIFRLMFQPVTVNFIDVGQGDSCLVIAGKGANVLIDGGEASSNAQLTDFLRHRNVRSLDAVFVSHFHSDHTGGIAKLIEQGFPIKCVYMDDGLHGEDKNEFVNLCNDKKVKVIAVKTGDKYKIGETQFDIVRSWSGRSSTNENNKSMVLKVSFGETDVLFTGDIEISAIEELLHKHKQSIDVEILKFPHHGGEKSSSIEFIRSCSPDFAIISAGVDNMYDLPSDIALENLAKEKVRTLRTDRDGTIEITLGKEGIKNIRHGNKWR